MSPRNATEINKRRHYEWRGEKFPSVTTLLKGYPQEWAIAYGAKHVAERAVFQFTELRERLNSDDPLPMTLSWLKAPPATIRDAAAHYGTILHDHLESRFEGQENPDTAWICEAVATTGKGVCWCNKPSHQTALGKQAVDAFLDAYRPDPLLIESQVYSVSHRYAGSADAFATIYGRRVLLDLKTAGSYDPLAERPGKAGGDHKDRLQLAAYRYADFIGEDDRELGPVPDVEAAMVLSIPRDHPKAWRLIEVDAGPETFRRFLEFSAAWRWYDANKDQPIGEQVLPQVHEEVA